MQRIVDGTWDIRPVMRHLQRQKLIARASAPLIPTTAIPELLNPTDATGIIDHG
jgi:hypothetical protein